MPLEGKKQKQKILIIKKIFSSEFIRKNKGQIAFLFITRSKRRKPDKYTWVAVSRPIFEVTAPAKCYCSYHYYFTTKTITNNYHHFRHSIHCMSTLIFVFQSRNYNNCKVKHEKECYFLWLFPPNILVLIYTSWLKSSTARSQHTKVGEKKTSPEPKESFQTLDKTRTYQRETMRNCTSKWIFFSYNTNHSANGTVKA